MQTFNTQPIRQLVTMAFQRSNKNGTAFVVERDLDGLQDLIKGKIFEVPSHSHRGITALGEEPRAPDGHSCDGLETGDIVG